MKKKFLIVLYLTAVCALAFSSGLRDSFIHTLDNLGISPYLIIFILAMMPISELRGSMLFAAGINTEVNLIYAALLSIAGNMLPIFFILFVFKYFEALFRKVPFLSKIMDWVFERVRAKSKSIEKYEELGLMVFVAIPSPFTGAWTGSLAAYILNFSYAMSLLYIFLGVVCAGILMTIFAFLGLIPTLIGIGVLIIISLLKGFYDFLRGKESSAGNDEA